MNKLKLFSTLFLVVVTSVVSAQSDTAMNCKILRDIKLKYISGPDSTAYVVIKGNKHAEYLENGKYYIKSDLEWISDCEYKATLTAVTLPGFPFKPGVTMQVKYERIENGIIYGTGIIQGTSFPVKFEIMKQ